jgi:acetoin utilization protein AcuB
MNVGKRMSSPVLSVSPDLSVPDALAMMTKEKIRHMPVIEKGKLVGIVTKSDLLNASPSKATSLSVWEINYLINKIKVCDVMTKKVLTTTEDSTIEEAARVMSDHKISCLPVMRGKEVVGIITETNLFKIFLELLGARQKGVRISAEMANKPGELAHLSQAIYKAGGNIIALGTFAGETATTTSITIKVAGITEKALKKLVEPLVRKLLDIRTS